MRREAIAKAKENISIIEKSATNEHGRQGLSYTAENLKNLCDKLGLSMDGTKEELVKRILNFLSTFEEDNTNEISVDNSWKDTRNYEIFY